MSAKSRKRVAASRKPNTKKKRYQIIADKRSRLGIAEQALLSERDKKFDPNVTTDQLIADLRAVQALTPNKFITRNGYRINGKYSDSTWDSRFGTFLEFRKQAGLELSRGQQKLERDIAKHASLDVYRGFCETEVMPWVGKYERKHAGAGLKTILIMSDFHDIEVDKFVLEVAIDTAKRLQPDLIVFNGDIYDMYEFSRFTVDPRLANVRERMEFVREGIFGAFRKVCPNSQMDLILGNHEHRLLKHLAEKTPYLKAVLSDFMGLSLTDIFGLDKYRVNLVSKFDLAAYTNADISSETNRNYKVYFDTFTANHHADEHFGTSGSSGHTHKPNTKIWRDRTGTRTWITTGCMKRVDCEYIFGKHNEVNSFAIFHIEPKTGECIAEHVVFSSNLAVVGGIFYRRTP